MLIVDVTMGSKIVIDDDGREIEGRHIFKQAVKPNQTMEI